MPRTCFWINIYLSHNHKWIGDKTICVIIVVKAGSRVTGVNNEQNQKLVPIFSANFCVIVLISTLLKLHQSKEK